MVAFVLAGGVIADRFGRALVIQGSNLLSALSQGVLATLLLTGHAELWHFVALSAFNGTVLGRQPCRPSPAWCRSWSPASSCSRPTLLTSMSRNALAILGPSVAATLVVTVGPGWALAVDAATWAVSAVLLLPIRIPRG